MPIANHRALSTWGILGGLLLIVVGIALLASTGGFAFIGLAGFYNGAYVAYVSLDLLGIAFVIGGLLVAWRF